MARDRLVYWTDQRPNLDEVKTALEDYTHGLGTVSVGGKVLTVWFPGKPTDPFERLRKRENIYHYERWFEVLVEDSLIDVITRAQDPIVNAIAEGFAKTVALHWKGNPE